MRHASTVQKLTPGVGRQQLAIFAITGNAMAALAALMLGELRSHGARSCGMVAAAKILEPTMVTALKQHILVAWSAVVVASLLVAGCQRAEPPSTVASDVA